MTCKVVQCGEEREKSGWLGKVRGGISRFLRSQDSGTDPRVDRSRVAEAGSRRESIYGTADESLKGKMMGLIEEELFL